MTRIRVTKEFRFEAAHALKGYDGPCRNVHGHSYELSVTISGTPGKDPNSSKLGMVMDFGDLKRMIKKEIIEPFDHALILNSAMGGEDLLQSGEPFSNVLLVPYQPTSENILIDFAERIRKLLPPAITLFSLRLRETATSYAEWFAQDN
ncbi:MAG: 6-carboxytetrahydropterin synthase [Bacteroidetes bacterium]|nr:6-carboxytetrahydropterin synthase [Bacteroidota bacterium]